MSWHVNSHKLDCAPAMLGHCHVLCESQHGCLKNLNFWSAAHCLRVYVIYKQALNVESVHYVSTSDKYFNRLWSRWAKKCMQDFMWNACFYLQYQISWQSKGCWCIFYLYLCLILITKTPSLSWTWFWRNCICSSKCHLAAWPLDSILCHAFL